MMYLLEIKNKRGLVLNKGLTIAPNEYLERFNKLHESLGNYNNYLDIEIIQVNVSYDSLIGNNFISEFDLDELKQVKFIPLSRHLYRILRYNY